jgi:hypothetical protein
MAWWRIAGLAVCGWLFAAESVRFAESVGMPDVAGATLPAAMTVESATADLLAAPSDGAAVVQRLRVGDRLTVQQFIEGPERRRDCKAVPFDGCIFRTSVWAHARTSAGKTGYSSLSDLQAPLVRNAIPQEPETLFGYSNAVQSQDFSVDSTYLPKASGPSFVDRLGWSNVMGKVLAPAGELVASRRDLEFLARQSGGSFAYEGTARRVPADATLLPALIQPILLNPPLTALALYEDHAEVTALGRADGVGYASLDPRTPADATPLRFRLPPAARNAVAMVLFASSAGRQISKERIKVATARYSSKVYDTTIAIRVTGVDLDGDGQPELLRYLVTESSPGCNPRTDLCGGQRAAMLALHNGVWHITGFTRPGQDGMEGY